MLRSGLHRRQPGGVKNLVRVRVTDPAEQMRVGQGALDGVVLAAQCGRKFFGSRVQDFETARIVCLEAVSPRTRYKEACRFDPASVSNSVPAEKSKAARPTFPGSRARFFPPKPSCNHQMKHRKELSSSSQTIRLPSRRRPVTSRSMMASTGGSIDRTRKGLARRTRSSRWPTIRGQARAGRVRCPEARAGCVIGALFHAHAVLHDHVDALQNAM